MILGLTPVWSRLVAYVLLTASNSAIIGLSKIIRNGTLMLVETTGQKLVIWEIMRTLSGARHGIGLRPNIQANVGIMIPMYWLRVPILLCCALVVGDDLDVWKTSNPSPVISRYFAHPVISYVLLFRVSLAMMTDRLTRPGWSCRVPSAAVSPAAERGPQTVVQRWLLSRGDRTLGMSGDSGNRAVFFYSNCPVLFRFDSCEVGR